MRKTVCNITHLFELHKEALQPVKALFQNYNNLFLFMEVLGWMVDKNDVNPRTHRNDASPEAYWKMLIPSGQP